MDTLKRIIRAPFFLTVLVLSMVPVFFLFAWVSVGAWIEGVLRWLGYKERPWWLPAVLGFVGYGGVGVVLPAYLGSLLIGWPGAVAGPLLALGVVAVLGRW